MTQYSGVCPSAEKLLSTLINLYADQMGVKVKYQIVDSEEVKEASK